MQRTQLTEWKSKTKKVMNFLEKKRTKKKVTRTLFSKVAKVSPTLVYMHVNGYRTPTPITVARYATSLGVLKEVEKMMKPFKLSRKGKK